MTNITNTFNLNVFGSHFDSIEVLQFAQEKKRSRDWISNSAGSTIAASVSDDNEKIDDVEIPEDHSEESPAKRLKSEISICDEIERLKCVNLRLSNDIQEYQNIIDEIMQEITTNNQKIISMCDHKWQKDLTEIERTKYYCSKCHVPRNI